MNKHCPTCPSEKLFKEKTPEGEPCFVCYDCDGVFNQTDLDEIRKSEES